MYRNIRNIVLASLTLILLAAYFPIHSQAQTAGWSNYTNIRAKYTLEYPQDMTVYDIVVYPNPSYPNTDIISIGNISGGNDSKWAVEIRTHLNAGGSLKSWLENSANNNFSGDYDISKFTKLSDDPETYVHNNKPFMFSKVGNKVLEIIGHNMDGVASGSNYQQFQHLIETLVIDDTTRVIDPQNVHVHSVGTNIRTTDGTIYRITSDQTRQPYTSANIFSSYKFNKWADVAIANEEDLKLIQGTPMPPRDGTMWNDNGTVYIVSEGKARQPFVSADVFNGYGYSFNYVYPGKIDYLESYPNMSSSSLIHPDGTLIKHNGTYYIMNSHERLGVPSLQVLESWGYWLEDAVEANQYDLATPSTTVLSTRPYEQYRY